MYIQCTQKLLAKLEQPYGVLPNPPEPFFCWHASYFEDDSGLLYVVMMNDYTGDEVFFELQSFKDFSKTMLEEMRLDMEDAGASAKEISAYFKTAGPVMFGPTSDSSAVGRLSGFTRRMKNFVGKMQDLMDILKDPVRREELASALEQSMDITSEEKEKFIAETRLIDLENEITPMVALDVELVLTGKKRVKRSFLVPLYIPFGTLHIILQIGFGWYDSHLHEFSLKQGAVTIGTELEHLGVEQDDDMLDEDTTMLSDFIPNEKRIEYLYDFGDSWQHIIKVGKIKNVKGGPFVECTGGDGSTPPEDCGGMFAYDDLCAVLSDPSHEDYDELFEWAGDDFDVGFDQDLINDELKELQFIPYPGSPL